MHSISTGMPIGSEPMPTAERACLPRSPNTSTKRSEQPLITLGWSSNSGTAFTIPSTLTTRRTLSKLLPECGGTIYLLRASLDYAEAESSWGEHAVPGHPLLAPQECWALRRGQPHYVNDVHSGATCSHLDLPPPTTPATTACLPLSAQNLSLGFLYLSMPGHGPMPHIDIAIAAAEQLSLAVGNLQLQDTLRQIQEIRTYYDFPDIDIDRYTIANQYRQVEISARELDTSRLPQAAQNWVNQHLQYTHGYGLSGSPVNAIAAEGLPDYVVRDIPPTGPLTISDPAIYFGELTANPVLAPSKSTTWIRRAPRSTKLHARRRHRRIRGRGAHCGRHACD